MPIYDNDGSASREIGRLYDHNGSANAQIGKVYDNNGSANTLIYTSALPVTLASGSSTAAEIGGWATDKNIWETSTWKWTGGSGGVYSVTSAGQQMGIYAVSGSRNGLSLISGHAMDWSGTASVTVRMARTANGYYVTGSGCDGAYSYAAAMLQTSTGANPAAYTTASLKGGLNADKWLTLSVPSGFSGYLRICIFTTDGGGFTATVKSITTAER